eukprot:COSAG01_NODE_620_length_14784_cov_49.916718_4_plen_183_part_00
MPLQVRQRVSAHPSLRFISICLAKARCLASPRCHSTAAPSTKASDGSTGGRPSPPLSPPLSRPRPPQPSIAARLALKSMSKLSLRLRGCTAGAQPSLAQSPGLETRRGTVLTESAATPDGAGSAPVCHRLSCCCNAKLICNGHGVCGAYVPRHYSPIVVWTHSNDRVAIHTHVGYEMGRYTS